MEGGEFGAEAMQGCVNFVGWVGGFVGEESRESESGEHHIGRGTQVDAGWGALPLALWERVAPNPRA